MPAIYIYVYFHQGVYANVGINLYFVAAGVYGLVRWRRTDNGAVTHAPSRIWLPAMAAGAVMTVGIFLLLRNFTDSTVPWMDAITTSYSIVGLWMLAEKWAEQWLVWIVIDAVYTIMYAHLDMLPTAVMYGVFSVVAVFGYFKWKRMI